MENVLTRTRKTAFKKCAGCEHTWESRKQFLEDPEVEEIGYQANFSAEELGLFLFNHCCGTTLALEAKTFADLYEDDVYVENRHDDDHCPGYCNKSFLKEACPAKCACRYVRDILDVIKEWEKSPAE